MELRIYNLVYAIFSTLFGTDLKYESAEENLLELYATEMLEGILEYLR